MCIDWTLGFCLMKINLPKNFNFWMKCRIFTVQIMQKKLLWLGKTKILERYCLYEEMTRVKVQSNQKTIVGQPILILNLRLVLAQMYNAFMSFFDFVLYCWHEPPLKMQSDYVPVHRPINLAWIESDAHSTTFYHFIYALGSCLNVLLTLFVSCIGLHTQFLQAIYL